MSPRVICIRVRMVFQSGCVSGDPVLHLGVRELAIVSWCAVELFLVITSKGGVESRRW